MNEIQAILDASTLPQELKQRALSVAFEIAAPIAIKNVEISANGQFLALLIELLKLLLPILLELLNPKV